MPFGSKLPDILMSKVLKQPDTQIESTIGASRTSILNDSLCGLAAIANRDGFTTFRRRVRVSKLLCIESNRPGAIGVKVSTCTKADFGIVKRDAASRKPLFVLMVGQRKSECQGGESESSQGGAKE